MTAAALTQHGNNVSAEMLGSELAVNVVSVRGPNLRISCSTRVNCETYILNLLILHEGSRLSLIKKTIE